MGTVLAHAGAVLPIPPHSVRPIDRAGRARPLSSRAHPRTREPPARRRRAPRRAPRAVGRHGRHGRTIGPRDVGPGTSGFGTSGFGTSASGGRLREMDSEGRRAGSGMRRRAARPGCARSGSVRPRRALRMLLLLAALAPGSAAAQVRTVPGERLVTLRAAPDAAALRRLEVETGGRVLATIPQLRLVRLALPPGGGEAVALRAVDRLAEVEASQPIGIGQGGFVPADPLFAAQWHLEHTGQVEGTPGADIDAPRGWASTRGDADVVVAVLDSGI